MTSEEKLNSKISEGKHICVGLDSDIKKLPEAVSGASDPVFEFNRRIIEATAGNAAAYKINLAFYEVLGKQGWETLEKTLEVIPEDILVIADAKRGDIGNTSRMYAQAFYDTFGFDSITLHPYMGIDSIAPFTDYREKLNFVLALTSNTSNADFEKLELEDGRYLFNEVIAKCRQWNINKNIGIVFGATNPAELKKYLAETEGLPLLLPGIGAQQGNADEILSILAEGNKKEFLINVSRGIIFADNSENFDTAAGKILEDYNTLVNKYFPV